MKNKLLLISASIILGLSPLAGYAEGTNNLSEQMYSEQSMLYYKKGRELYRNLNQKDLENAINVYDKGIKENKNSPLLYAGKVESMYLLYIYKSLKMESNIEKAKIENEITRNATFALDLAPNLAESHRAMSIAYTVQNRTKEAYQEAKKALDLNKADAESYLWLWNLTKRDPKSSSIITATSLDPDSPLINMFLALAYDEDKNQWSRDSQFELINKVIEKSPNNDVAYLFLGSWNILYRSNNDEAIKSLEKALEIEPKNPLASFYTGYAYLRKRMDWKAVDYLKRACSQGVTQSCDIVKQKNY